MQGHESITKKTTPKPFGSEAAASAKIDNVIRVAPPKDFVYKPNTLEQEPIVERIESGTPLYRKSPKFFAPPSQNSEGPLVVKVYPDGRPVEEQNVVPQDEDLRQYLLAKVKLPDYWGFFFLCDYLLFIVI